MTLQLLREWSPLEYSKDIIEEEKVKNGGKIVLRGVIQRADTLNQNGRIYPKAVLERELRNYQKFIQERRAIGELDHPACVPMGSETFTVDGWRRIEDLREGDIVATLNTDTSHIEFQPVLAHINEPYKGEMFRFKNARTYDMTLTPEHRVLLWDRAQQPKYIAAKDIYALCQDRSSWLSHSCLKRSGIWTGEEHSKFVVPGSDRTFDIEDWAAFLGIFVAEGHTAGSKSGNNIGYGIGISQSENAHPETFREIRELLQRMNISFNERNGFSFSDKALHAYLRQLGNSHEKHLPADVKSWSPRLLDILMTWMLKGDGRNRKTWDKESIIRELSTTSKQLADDAFEVFLKLGSGATIHTYSQIDRPAPGFNETGRMILAENSAPMNIVAEHGSRSMSLDWRFMRAEKFEFNDRVYCITTKNGNWLMRQNGCTCWTGNSSVIELKNGSHVITEAYMDGDVVYGKIEVLDKLPMGKILAGYIEHGIKVGISSRGVGSTQTESGHQKVNDDFQLVCFDVVSEPSTPSAFLLPEGKIIYDDAGLPIIGHPRDSRKKQRVMKILNSILG
jgi:hypothetical protein